MELLSEQLPEMGSPQVVHLHLQAGVLVLGPFPLALQEEPLVKQAWAGSSDQSRSAVVQLPAVVPVWVFPRPKPFLSSVLVRMS
jgi:hypothetical protein